MVYITHAHSPFIRYFHSSIRSSVIVSFRSSCCASFVRPIKPRSIKVTVKLCCHPFKPLILSSHYPRLALLSCETVMTKCFYQRQRVANVKSNQPTKRTVGYMVEMPVRQVVYMTVNSDFTFRLSQNPLDETQDT